MVSEVSQKARDAAAEFWEFLGQCGSAEQCRQGKGFRTTADVFARFEAEIRAEEAARIALGETE